MYALSFSRSLSLSLSRPSPLSPSHSLSLSLSSPLFLPPAPFNSFLSLSPWRIFFNRKPHNLRYDMICRSPEDCRILLDYCIRGHSYGKIVDYLAPGSITKDTTLFLMSALVFKGYWKHPFAVGRTEKTRFYHSSKRFVDMMVPDCGAQYLRYACVRSLRSEVVELPFYDSNVVLYVVLPCKNVRLAYVERKIKWNPDVMKLKRRKVYVTLPKFTIRKRYGLKKMLHGLGVTDAFNRRRANFQRMTNSTGLFMQELPHQGYIKVDEQGTEETDASATAKCGVEDSMPRRGTDTVFVANRPFLFFLWERRSKILLLSGRFQG